MLSLGQRAVAETCACTVREGTAALLHLAGMRAVTVAAQGLCAVMLRTKARLPCAECVAVAIVQFGMLKKTPLLSYAGLGAVVAKIPWAEMLRVTTLPPCAGSETVTATPVPIGRMR